MKMTKYAVSHVYCTASGGQLTHGDTERLNVDFHLKLWVVFFLSSAGMLVWQTVSEPELIHIW